MAQQKTPLVISGAAGVGKGTITDILTSKKAGMFSLTTSCTTREPRAGENDGIDYWFVSRQEFMEKVEAGDFLEWAEVHGNLYGTPCTELDRLSKMKRAATIEIDVQGALQLALKIPQACFVFIEPPSMAELERRLRGRGTESEESILRRLSIAEDECRRADTSIFKHVINGECVFETATSIVRIWRGHM